MKQISLRWPLVFAFLAFSIFFIHNQSSYAHQSRDEQTTVIHIDEEGYSPKSVEIELGTKVIFENEGNESQWAAADDHPSHTLYDGTTLEEHCREGGKAAFDSCAAINHGEEWEFVFDKAGTYKYHDHLWPHLGGEITVLGSDISINMSYLKTAISPFINFFTSNKESNNILKSGSTDKDFYQNLKMRFENIVIESDPREAILQLQKESLEDEDVLALCHDILHEIGHISYEKYGSFKEGVKYQEDFCNSGYLHGLFESYFELEDDPLDGLSEQCIDYAEGKERFDMWQCYHGIGHGFMYLTGGDLDQSLELCSKEVELQADISSCNNGVFMEVFNSEVLAKEEAYVDPDDPLKTCLSHDVAKGDCYIYSIVYFSQALNMEFADIIEKCDAAESRYKPSCLHGIGSEAMKRNMDNPNKVFKLCKIPLSTQDQESCIRGLVSIYLNQLGDYSAGKELCENAPQEQQGVCKKAVESKKSFFE